MDLRQYVHAVRTYWWIIALPAVLGALSGAYSVSNADPEYRASVTFFITSAVESDSASGSVQIDEFGQRRVNTYVELVESDRLAEAILDETQLDLTVGQVKRMLSAKGDIDTVLLTATVTSESRDLASLVADALATEFVEYVAALETIGSGPASVDLEVVDGPSVGQAPAQGKLTIGIRGVLGALLGLGVALLLELRDNTVRTDEQLQELGIGPVLGMIPMDRRVRYEPLAVHDVLQSVRAEAFRQLRTNLEFIDVERPVRVLVVTSSVGEEGKSSTCANLALALVAANRRVLLVEADLRRPTVTDYFDVDASVGLSDVIVGRASLDEALQPWGSGGMWVLTSGALPPNPSELLGTEAMGDLIHHVRERFDAIVINTPPLLPVTDAAVVSAHADGVLLVIRSGKTSRHQLQVALRSLHAVGAHMLGVVMNMVPVSRGSSYASYYPTLPTAAPDETQPPAAVPGAAVDSEPVAVVPEPVTVPAPEAALVSDPGADPDPVGEAAPERPAVVLEVVPDLDDEPVDGAVEPGAAAQDDDLVGQLELDVLEPEASARLVFERLLSVSDPEFAEPAADDVSSDAPRGTT